MAKRYRDPDENDDDFIDDDLDSEDIKPKVIRDFTRARLHNRTIVTSLSQEVRSPLGIVNGTKLMVTVDLENQALILTKE